MEDENYVYFLMKMRRHLLPLVDLLCYCLMPNHFHFLLAPKAQASMPSNAVKPRLGVSAQAEEVPDRQEQLSHAIGTLLSSYTKAINKRYGRTGSLFRARTKMKAGWIEGPITASGSNSHLFFKDDLDYARQCFDYIHQNPVRARIVSSATDWIYSSARDYSGLRNGDLCNQHLAKALGLVN